MPPKSRRLIFFELRSVSRVDHETELNPWPEVVATLQRLEELGFENRKLDHANDAYYTRYVDSQIQGNYIRMKFTTAKNGYSAPLQDKDTGARRPNPKTIGEGEEMITHVVLKRHPTRNAVAANDHYLTGCIECGQGLINMHQFVLYLNRFLPDARNSRFNLIQLLSEDFLRTIERAEKVVEMELEVAKNYIPNELGLPARRALLQENISIVLKPKRNMGIAMKNYVLDSIREMGVANVEVNRIRVKAYDQSNNKFKIDDTKLLKQSFVRAHADDTTGIIQSNTIFPEMETTLHDL